MQKSSAREKQSGGFGRFTGDVVAKWLVHDGPDRNMRLEANFEYTDPDGIRWPAPKGRVIDGASIPSAFWGPLIGSPYTGDFRRASVVHDVACEDMPYTSDIVHLMLLNAMRCDGTAEWLAREIFSAVMLFGPQWGTSARPLPLTDENIGLYRELIHSPAIDADLKTLKTAIARTRVRAVAKGARNSAANKRYGRRR